MMERELESLATAVALWTIVTLLIKLIRILLKWNFRLGCCAGVSIWENFHPGYRDLGNRASPASHI